MMNPHALPHSTTWIGENALLGGQGDTVPVRLSLGRLGNTTGTHSQRFVVITELKDPSRVVLREVVESATAINH
jgi:hypothetical protein